MARGPLWRPSRRGLLRAGAAGAAGLVGAGLPRPARASISAADRRFLVIFAIGGWDTSYALWPFFDYEGVDVDSGLAPASENGHSFVEADAAPDIRSFYEDWGSQTCALHGFEIPSITHDRCRRLLFTGGTSTQADDFGTILAAHGGSGLLLPHVVLSGPAYNFRYGSSLVRAGTGGQLSGLLDGTSIISDIDAPAKPINEEVDAAVDALVRERAAAFAEVAPAGRPASFAGNYDTVLGTMATLDDDAIDVNISVKSFDDQLSTAMDLLASGLSRVVTVQHRGADNGGWDEHIYIGTTTSHFGDLFGKLNGLMSDLSSRTGLLGGSLLDEVTVVVVSEMGRHPQFNDHGGKHHWTFTSCLLMGSGIAGGRMIGSYDESVLGEPVDFESGELYEDGAVPTCQNLGATLLALGDVDPTEFTDGAEPVAAMMA